MKKMTRFTRSLAALTVVAGVGLAACGGAEQSDTTSGASSDSTLATSEASVVVTGQWARASSMATTMGAAYMDIVATAGDELLDASVDASVAGMVELHEVVAADGSDMDDHSSMGSDTTMAMSGEMKMQEVESIELPAGETVSLKPGGYHVMLMDLVAPLKTGTSIEVTLTFATAGKITIEVPVLDEAP